MFESVIIYGIVTFVLMVSGEVYCEFSNTNITAYKRCKYIPLLFGCIFFAMIFGARWNVGADHLAYLSSYEQAKYHHEERTEPLFNIIQEILSENGFHFFWFFFLYAFIQISCITFAIRKYPDQIKWVLFVFMTSPFLYYMNGMRQATVNAVFIYLLCNIKNYSFIKFSIIIVLCSLIHKTALLLLPLYPILNYTKNLTGGIKSQLILLLLFFAIAKSKIISNYFEFISEMVFLIDYDEKYGTIDFNKTVRDNFHWGVGTYNLIILFIFSIINTNIYKKELNYPIFKTSYNLYFWGFLFSLLFLENHLIRRIFEYYTALQIIVIGFILDYLWKIKNKNFKCFINFSLYLLLNIFVFAGTIYSSSVPDSFAKFTFFFQK